MAFNINLPQKHERYNNRASFPATGSAKILYVANDTLKLYTYGNSTYTEVDKELASSWGSVSQAPKPAATSVSKADIGLDNVDNTSDLDKPVSTQTQNVLDNKQDLLFSGTNIKTVNSTSVLGSGDIAVQPTLVSGTNIKTINGSSVLGSGDLTISASASWGGITGTLTSQTDLNTALNSKQATLSAGTNIKNLNGFSLLGSGNLSLNVGVQNQIRSQSGTYLSTMANGTAASLGGVTGVANRLYVYPFIPAQDITMSAFNFFVSSGVAGALARVVTYTNGTTNNGDYPNLKSFESTNIDCSTAGIKTISSFSSFNKGQIYWIGLHVSSSAIVMGTIQSNMISLGYSGATNNFCHIQQSTTFGSLPSAFGTGSYQTTICPHISITIS